MAKLKSEDCRSTLAYCVRDAAEFVCKSRVLRHKCSVVSCALVTVWRGIGIPSQLAAGTYVKTKRTDSHLWVYSYDGLNWDLTRTQYSGRADRVSVVSSKNPTYKLFFDDPKAPLTNCAYPSTDDVINWLIIVGLYGSYKSILLKTSELFSSR